MSFSYFILDVPMRKCLVEHSCMRPTFSIDIFYSTTCSLRSAKTANRSVSGVLLNLTLDSGIRIINTADLRTPRDCGIISLGICGTIRKHARTYDVRHTFLMEVNGEVKHTTSLLWAHR